MADSKIVITAGLQIPETVSTIKNDLSKVSNELNSIEALKITCFIDTKNLSGLQKQLNEVSKNLKVNVASIGADKIVDEKSIKNQAKALTDALDLTIPRGKTKEVRDTIQGLINDYQRAFQSGNYDEITKSFSALEAYVDQFRKDVQDINKDFVEMQQHVKELARSGKTFISENDYNELKYLLDGGKNANKLLTQAFGLGGWTKDKLKATTSWDSKVQELNEVFDLSRFDSLNDIDSGKFNDHIDGVIQLVNYLNQSFDQGSDFVKEYGAEIDKAFGDQLYTELNRVLGVSTSLDGEFVELFNPDEVQQTTEEVQKLGNEIQRTISKLPDISVGSSTKETLESAKSVLNNYFEASNIDGEANRVKRAIEDTTGELQRFYVQVERGDKSVETLTYAINEQGTAYEYLGKTIREADNSTDFRRKDIETQWDIQTQKLQQFIANAEKAGAASTVLSDDIANLKNKLNDKGDTSAMNSFLDDFDIAKAKFQAFNAEARKDNALANLQNRIKRLTADINSYAAANKRAVESTKQMTSGRSFADEWTRITSVMAKGADLTDRELKDLSADMAVFRKEAQAAGLAGESAFGKFINSFKVMSSYITANMVFNAAKRQLSQMVEEVKAVDTAMVELRKVTSATEYEFQEFAKSATKTGIELGASVSDVINATSTFSRAGFNLPDAEELGKVATLYKNVGDGITIDSASESIISVMKAFNIEAENSIGIIDRINEVSNRAAIDSGGLGLALQRVASAMDAANNSLDETIALTTVSNEIVQNPEMVAQGWRTVALRIRGAKSELEDAGLETEGMVESTAKLRDLIKGISGVDIMLDENTFKSTYQIIDELGRVWNKISDINQASLLEAIAGRFYLNVQKCA
jgi:TP901 family phage tail tape measure protein